MEIFFLWLVLAFVPAYIASQKGRNGIGWFFIGLLISPLIALIIVCAIPKVEKEARTDDTTEKAIKGEGG